MAVWTVKGGAKGEAEDTCLTDGVIGKGGRVPDLADVASRNEITTIWSREYPEMTASQTANHVGQLWSLVRTMQEGEMVVLPLKTTGTIAVGRIGGQYKYRPDLVDTLRHTRPVRWLKTDLARDSFDQDLLFSFGAFITVGQVRRDRAEERILAVVGGKPSLASADDAEVGSVETAPDIDALAREQVRQHISHHIGGHDLAHLVAEVLKARGLKPARAHQGLTVGSTSWRVQDRSGSIAHV